MILTEDTEGEDTSAVHVQCIGIVMLRRDVGVRMRIYEYVEMLVAG